VLSTALSRGGANYRLPNPGKAKHWRQRAYTFRKLLREAAEHNAPGNPLDVTTPYDSMTLTISKRDPSCVQINFSRAVDGVLTDETGAPLTLDGETSLETLLPPPPDPNPDGEEVSELDDIAEAFRRRLLGEDI
jgi:hypothetical protein